jgi:hypothetical protein
VGPAPAVAVAGPSEPHQQPFAPALSSAAYPAEYSAIIPVPAPNFSTSSHPQQAAVAIAPQDFGQSYQYYQQPAGPAAV